MVVQNTPINACAALRLHHPAECEAADPEKSDADSPKDIEDFFGPRPTQRIDGYERGLRPRRRF
jgi:hypothetical protein